MRALSTRAWIVWACWILLCPSSAAVAAQEAGSGSDPAPPEGGGLGAAAAPLADELAEGPALSMLVRPVYLAEEPPETRALRYIVLQDHTVPGVSRVMKRTPEEALELAHKLHAELENGADFGALVRTYSESPVRHIGGILGSFARGMLEPELDAFLFSSELGDYSEPVVTPGGTLLVQRVVAHAACAQIQISGEDAEARAQDLLERLRAGADFAELAREHSSDAASAARGGHFSIFERSPFDRLLKKATFEAEVGEVVGPIESPLGFHLVKRLPVDAVDPELTDPVWIRARAILVVFGGAPDYPYWIERTAQEAEQLAQELHARIAAGEDMAALAREFDDDPAGRVRSGDLGWIHRRAPNVAPVVQPLFLSDPGTLLEPVAIAQGYAILRRER